MQTHVALPEMLPGNHVQLHHYVKNLALALNELGEKVERLERALANKEAKLD